MPAYVPCYKLFIYNNSVFFVVGNKYYKVEYNEDTSEFSSELLFKLFEYDYYYLIDVFNSNQLALYLHTPNNTKDGNKELVIFNIDTKETFSYAERRFSSNVCYAKDEPNYNKIVNYIYTDNNNIVSVKDSPNLFKEIKYIVSYKNITDNIWFGSWKQITTAADKLNYIIKLPDNYFYISFHGNTNILGKCLDTGIIEIINDNAPQLSCSNIFENESRKTITRRNDIFFRLVNSSGANVKSSFDVVRLAVQNNTVVSEYLGSAIGRNDFYITNWWEFIDDKHILWNGQTYSDSSSQINTYYLGEFNENYSLLTFSKCKSQFTNEKISFYLSENISSDDTIRCINVDFDGLSLKVYLIKIDPNNVLSRTLIPNIYYQKTLNYASSVSIEKYKDEHWGECINFMFTFENWFQSKKLLLKNIKNIKN